MNKRTPLSVAIVCAALAMAGLGRAAADAPHTPKKGSAEQKSILKALKSSPSNNYKVHYIKVHNGWAWVDVTPLDAKGKATAEGGPNLLHQKAGAWSVEDISKVEDPDDPLGAEDASAGFVKNLLKKFPSAPKDIFPKPKH